MKECKKLFVLSLALLMVVFTVACGTDKNKNNADDMANRGNSTVGTTDNNTAADNRTDDTGVLDPDNTAGPGTGGNSTAAADDNGSPISDVVDGVADGVDDVADGIAEGVDDITDNTTDNTVNNTNANVNR